MRIGSLGRPRLPWTGARAWLPPLAGGLPPLEQELTLRSWSTGVARRVGSALVVSLLAVVSLLPVGCSSPSAGPNVAPSGCTVQPLAIVVTTNVWSSVVDQLVGACGHVLTIVSSPTADPHDFEPTTETSAAFARADLVVMNGLGYDSWAERVLASLGDEGPDSLDLGAKLGLAPGVNPHIWYSPDFVARAADAIVEALRQGLLGAVRDLESSSADFQRAMEPYRAAVSDIRERFAGAKIGATESLFAYMADATGLVVTTPARLQAAVAGDSEPSPSDIRAAREQLTDGTDQALIFNLQVEGALPEQLRDLADASGVPVVGITETLVPAGATFQEWQRRQLDELARALGG